jgi:hypothetical protein
LQHPVDGVGNTISLFLICFGDSERICH